MASWGFPKLRVLIGVLIVGESYSLGEVHPQLIASVLARTNAPNPCPEP